MRQLRALTGIVTLMFSSIRGGKVVRDFLVISCFCPSVGHNFLMKRPTMSNKNEGESSEVEEAST